MSTLRVSAINNPSASSGGLAISAAGNVTGAGMDLIVAQDFSSMAAVNIDGCFTTAYENYRVFISNMTLTTAGLYQIWIRMRSGGADSSADYRTQFWRLYSGAIAANGGSASNSLMSLGYASTGNTCAYSMDFMSPARSVATTQVFQGHAYQSDIATYIAIVGSNTQAGATAFDGFKLSCDAGTNLSGTIRVYGYRNS